MASGSAYHAEYGSYSFTCTDRILTVTITAGADYPYFRVYVRTALDGDGNFTVAYDSEASGGLEYVSPGSTWTMPIVVSAGTDYVINISASPTEVYTEDRWIGSCSFKSEGTAPVPPAEGGGVYICNAAQQFELYVPYIYDGGAWVPYRAVIQ